MKTQFDTEKEAQTTLKHARAKGLGWCPLIKRGCNMDCICYYEGDTHCSPGNPAESQQFCFIYYPCCTNVLISGVITVES